MIQLFYLLLILQGLLIMIDEFFFHHRRHLPTWELWGHPLDTVFTLVPLLSLLFSPPFWLYSGLAAFSCVFITKDEWVHRELCSAVEMWLHALLFVVHPIVFVSAWASYGEGLPPHFLLCLLPMALFLFYQLYLGWTYDQLASRSTSREQ